ncbi:MAG TPA: cytochrome c3 family protein [Terriglobales bacterium]
MRVKRLFACVVLLAARTLLAQITGEVIGMHDLSPGSASPVTGARAGSCTYCHAPHSGLATGRALWNQTLTKGVYNLYTSPTYVAKGEKGQQPIVGSDTNLCLSCHDGTIAVGNTIVSGQITTTGQMNANDQFLLNTPNLMASHPQDLGSIQDTPDLFDQLASKGQTNDPTGAVKLIKGNIECTSCHNPHVQAKDPFAQFFLVKDSSSGAMCLACHDPNRVVTGQTNPLAGWGSSIHATSSATVQNLPYGTLSQNACFSCHKDHNASGTDWVLRSAGDQDCLNCHSGTTAATATNLNPLGRSVAAPAPSLVGPAKAMPSLNVAAEYGKIGHPMSTGNTSLQARAAARSRAATLSASPNTPDQAGCIDCHEPHAIGSGSALTVAPTLRAAQKAVWGVSEKDGTTVVRPAQYQFQTCLRCHGTKSRKVTNALKYGYSPVRLASVAEPMNVIPQFGASAGSSHPVFYPRRSSLPQPSLLPNMWNLNGTTQGRAMGTQIFCTDCHNSDDNREFGGTGPIGPHGSKWGHILERRYEFSQAPAPGQSVTNLFPTPDLSANGPYALCGKCHNLSSIMQNASFAKHALHINAGFSCSTCHTAHGAGSSSSNSSGQRLISFDTNVVAPNGGSPVSYNQGPNTCTLTCHNAAHNPNGSVKFAGVILKK